jgi:hypothetical protein
VVILSESIMTACFTARPERNRKRQVTACMLLQPNGCKRRLDLCQFSTHTAALEQIADWPIKFNVE